jgi:hypothetical protein
MKYMKEQKGIKQERFWKENQERLTKEDLLFFMFCIKTPLPFSCIS